MACSPIWRRCLSANLPGAIGRMAAFGIGPLIAASIGIVLLGLLRTPLRWSGAIVLALSVIWAVAVPQPDVLISADGHNVGVRGPDGRLHLMRTAKDAFLLKEWLAADADPRAPTDASLADGVSCDEAGCVTPMAGGGLVALALKPEALTDDCERAALVVTARQASPACASAVMSGDRLRGQGATVLRRTATALPSMPSGRVASTGHGRPRSRALRRRRQRWRRLHAPRGRWTRHRRKPISKWRIEALPSFSDSVLRTTRNDGPDFTFLERMIFPQLERAEVKFLVFVGGGYGGRLDQREHRVRELLPDRNILRHDRQPAEPEHVAAGRGDVADLLPADLVDAQSLPPFGIPRAVGPRHRD